MYKAKELFNCAKLMVENLPVYVATREYQLMMGRSALCEFFLQFETNDANELRKADVMLKEWINKINN